MAATSSFAHQKPIIHSVFGWDFCPKTPVFGRKWDQVAGRRPEANHSLTVPPGRMKGQRHHHREAAKIVAVEPELKAALATGTRRGKFILERAR
jgi:hypothetical protein